MRERQVVAEALGLMGSHSLASLPVVNEFNQVMDRISQGDIRAFLTALFAFPRSQRDTFIDWEEPQPAHLRQQELPSYLVLPVTQFLKKIRSFDEAVGPPHPHSSAPSPSTAERRNRPRHHDMVLLHPTSTVRHALRLFSSSNTHRLYITNPKRVLIGVLSLQDCIRVLF